MSQYAFIKRTPEMTVTIPVDSFVDAAYEFCGAHLNLKQRIKMGVIWYKAYGVFTFHTNSNHRIQFTYKQRTFLAFGTFWFYQVYAFFSGFNYYPHYYRHERKHAHPQPAPCRAIN